MVLNERSDNLSMSAMIRRAFKARYNKQEGASGIDPRTMSPLSLAYIGDSVYDLFIRSYLITTTDHTAHKLHILSSSMVKASAQAQAYRAVEDMLSEQEQAAFKRGRNSHIGTIPKHASIQEYRTATGFEALLGHLFMAGEDERITDLMRIAIIATDPLE